MKMLGGLAANRILGGWSCGEHGRAPAENSPINVYSVKGSTQPVNGRRVGSNPTTHYYSG